MTPTDSLTIAIGTGNLTFADGAGPITVGAPVVSITAGTIDTGDRALMITTTTGTLTLNTNINAGAEALTLISGTGAIASDNSANTLTAGTVNLTQATNFDTAPRFTFANSVGALNVITTVSGSVRPWMIVEGRDFERHRNR